MIDHDDLDGLAAEYVLGTLSAAERMEVAERRNRDKTLDRAIAAWERRLGPLNDGISGIEPPPHLFATIARRLWEQPGARSAVTLMAPRATPRRWRSAAVGIVALAACLLLIAGWLLLKPHEGTPLALVAEMHRGEAGTTADEASGSKGAVGFVVTVNLKDHSIVAKPAAVRPTTRRSYELWLMRAGTKDAVSLGVISHAQPTAVPWRERYSPADFVGGTVIVTLEPEGGSPTGSPTGPVLFTGRLARPAP